MPTLSDKFTLLNRELLDLKIALLNSVNYDKKKNPQVNTTCNVVDMLLEISRNIQIHTCRVVNKKFVTEEDLECDNNWEWVDESGTTHYHNWCGKQPLLKSKRKLTKEERKKK